MTQTAAEEGHPRLGSGGGAQQMTFMARQMTSHLAQVARYLSSYSQAAGDLPADKLRLLDDLSSSAIAEYKQLMSRWDQRVLSEAEMKDQLTQLVQKMQLYLSQARHVCMESWARFHPLLMIFGSLVLFLSCVLCYVIAEAGSTMNVSYKHLLGYPALISLLLTAVLSLGTWMSFIDMDLVSLCALVTVIAQLSFLYIFRSERYAQKRWWSRPTSLLLSGPCVVLFFRCCALFSDSFVVAEGKAAPFFLTSLLLLTVAKAHWDGRLTLPTFTPLGNESLKPSLMPTYKKDGSRMLLLLAALGLCIRLSSLFHNCREETPECQPSTFLSPLSSVQDPELKNFSYIYCVLCLGIIIYLIRKWLQHYGNLNSSSPLVLYVRWGFPLIALGISCFWALSSGTEDSFAKLRELTHLALVSCPRAIYIFAGLGLLLSLWKPMTVYMKRSQDSSADSTVTTLSGVPGSQAELRHVIPQIYRKMQRTLKSRLQHNGEEGKKGAALEAYGLGSVYSAAMVIALSLLTLVLIMLHSERMIPAFLLLLLEALIILQIHGHVSNLYCAPDDSGESNTFPVPFAACFCCCINYLPHLDCPATASLTRTVP